jgi:hypothetical protein
MGDCSICCEPFNKSNRCKINCKTCDSDHVAACQSCAKRYILDQPTDPSCMVCKVEWDTEFLSNNFTKVFVNKELKNHRENYLLEKQIAMLPETQEYAEQLKLIEGLEKQKKIVLIKKRKLEKELRKLNTDIRQIDITVSEIKHGTYNKDKPKSQFIYKCPVNNCNGFLNERFECGICDNKICRHCMEIKGEDHECDEDKKETVKLLRQDTKPCPKCGELIHKLPNGCDQMYCIKCHTAFSWRTGQLERGHIHNPEYYRWMRENGRDIPRNPLDVRYDPCGNQIIDYTSLLRIVRNYFPSRTVQSTRAPLVYNNPVIYDSQQTVIIANMHRMIGHINYLNTSYQNENRYEEQHLRTMRANYILNNLTKDEFKKKLQMLEKKNNKSKKMNDVWNLLRLVLIEYIGKIAEQEYEKDEGIRIINEIIKESEKIRKYCNNSFYSVGKVFNMVYPGVNTEWIQINNWVAYIKEQSKTQSPTQQAP